MSCILPGNPTRTGVLSSALHCAGLWASAHSVSMTTLLGRAITSLLLPQEEVMPLESQNYQVVETDRGGKIKLLRQNANPLHLTAKQG